MNISKLLLYLCLSLIAADFISACNLRFPEVPAQTEAGALTSPAKLTPSFVPATLTHTPPPSQTPTSTPAPSPTITRTTRPSLTPRPSPTPTPSTTPTAGPRDLFDLRRSLIAKHGEEDHLIFHIIVRNSQAIPSSIQILDAETGQVTDPFDLYVSPIPNLCAQEETVGWKYFKTDKIFFEDLPTDYWGRLWGASFSYLINVKQTTGQEESITLTDPPGSCVNIVE